MKRFLALIIALSFTVLAEASYITDIDIPVPDKLAESAKWEQFNCRGGSYTFLPTMYEWVAWGNDPEDYKYLEPDDAIPTEHTEVNTWELSYAHRFCRNMYDLEGYNMVSFITMYNELIPYQSVAYGDKNLKFNYPFDIREYSWERLNFNDVDWKMQQHWLDIRHYLKDSAGSTVADLGWGLEDEKGEKAYYKISDEDKYWLDDESWKEILEYERKDHNDYFVNREFLYKTNIPKTVTLFDNILPSRWTLPASVTDFGLIGRVVPISRRKSDISTYPNDDNFYLLPETRKDYSYSHKDIYDNWDNPPYGLWRYAPYASRWFFADIVNAVAGELNQRYLLKEGDEYPYKKIPNYLLDGSNINIPIRLKHDEVEGIGLAYDYCKAMECARYNDAPNLEVARFLLDNYRKAIWNEVSENGKKPYKFFPYMAEGAKGLKKIIEDTEKIHISDSTWYYTIAYMVNANGVEGYS